MVQPPHDETARDASWDVADSRPVSMHAIVATTSVLVEHRIPIESLLDGSGVSAERSRGQVFLVVCPTLAATNKDLILRALPCGFPPPST